jgi:beta-lactamase superfamily II metal-dependent hydrolase
MLKMHFLNVGHGDCCIIEFPDRITMVDINRSKSMDKNSLKEVIFIMDKCHPEEKIKERIKNGEDPKKVLIDAGYDDTPQDPIKYIDKKNMKSFFRFISTHPHMDHLKGFGELNEKVSISNMWIVKNPFGPDKSTSKKSRQNDWSTYKKFRDSDGTTIKEKISSDINVLRPMEKSSDDFYNSDGINVLSPTPELLKMAEKTGNENIMSYVLFIKYGPHKIVLGGDAEEANWQYIYRNYPDLIKDITILKAPHHGRDAGYEDTVMPYMNPKYTIVSVGDTKSKDDFVINKYKEISTNLLTTRWKGNVTIECHENGEINCIPQYK